MKKALMFWLAVMFLFAGGMALWAAWKMNQRSIDVISVEQIRSTPQTDSAPPGSDAPILTQFTLTERSGRPFGSKDLEDHVHVVSFFFASCPSTCRQQNERMQQLQFAYKEKDVKFLSITCDPERDTPTALRQYADIFNADKDQWLFLTGDLLYTRRIGAEMYQVPVDKYSHTEKFVVVDRQGKIRGYYHWAKSDEFAALQKKLDELLGEELSNDADNDSSVAESEPTSGADQDAISGEVSRVESKD